jgi:hypothetical protein
MDQPVTYQQLLAEQYEENARDLLAFQQIEYDEVDDRQIDEVNAFQGRSNQAYTLERQNEFNTFAGNRNTEEIVSRPADFEDKSKFSVRYNKDVRLNTFNIDTRFRAYVIPGVLSTNSAVNQPNDFIVSAFDPVAVSSSAHFIFRIRRQIKNAISIKLSSLELPNTFANFSNARGNTSFQIRPVTVPVSDYYVVNIDPDESPEYYPNATLLCSAIQTALQKLKTDYPSKFPNADTFTCSLNTQGYIVIGNTSPTTRSYDFNFAYSPISIPLFDPLGVLMGFKTSPTLYKNKTINSSNSLTALYLPDLETDDYIYIRINDYTTVVPQTVNDTYFTVFAKIPLIEPKGQLIYDNDSVNSTNKTYRFLLPTNLQQLEIQLLDRAGQELTFDGNFSMTLEVEEVLNQSLYEKMREL